MAEAELNIKLFYEFGSGEDRDPDEREWVPVVPTSAHSGLYIFYASIVKCINVRFLVAIHDNKSARSLNV